MDQGGPGGQGCHVRGDLIHDSGEAVIQLDVLQAGSGSLDQIAYGLVAARAETVGRAVETPFETGFYDESPLLDLCHANGAHKLCAYSGAVHAGANIVGITVYCDGNSRFRKQPLKLAASISPVS